MQPFFFNRIMFKNKLMKFTLFFAAILSLTFFLFSSCEKDETAETPETIECTGILQIQGITTYQYGSHIISNNEFFYALRSQTISLDNYVGETVTIKGEKVEGYPIEGGPDYIEVTEVIQ